MMGRRLDLGAGKLRVLALIAIVAFGCTDDDVEPIEECPLGAPYCGGTFPLNAQNTTQYGPPWVNATSQFWPCFGPYALCYYADCVTDATSTLSECPCDSLFGLNFVEESSILNLPVYEETVKFCDDAANNCEIPNTAPVCAAINTGTFYEGVFGVLAVSDFSFVGFSPSAAIGTDCTATDNVYSGCMTSACYGDGNGGFNCICPKWDGPYQVGQTNVACDNSPKSWSAAYNPDAIKPPVPPDPPIGCFPDVGVADGNEKACPLYVDPATNPVPPGTDCAEVCNEYDTCMNTGSDVQLGYTCDTALCTTPDMDIVLPACLGLQNCSVSAIMTLELLAGCSCCASQICGCAPNADTNAEIDFLNAAQTAAGDATQCVQNGTLCGTQ